MNDSPMGEKTQVTKHQALVMEFITEVNRDLERFRFENTDLAKLDANSWRKVLNAAHNIGARAEALKLGVLEICARELEQFATDVLKTPGSNKSEFIQGSMIAIEMLDLELNALKKSVGSS
jgi:hypothetical protein